MIIIQWEGVPLFRYGLYLIWIYTKELYTIRVTYFLYNTVSNFLPRSSIVLGNTLLPPDT